MASYVATLCVAGPLDYAAALCVTPRHTVWLPCVRLVLFTKNHYSPGPSRHRLLCQEIMQHLTMWSCAPALVQDLGSSEVPYFKNCASSALLQMINNQI